jgi:hypothetical protein
MWGKRTQRRQLLKVEAFRCDTAMAAADDELFNITQPFTEGDSDVMRTLETPDIDLFPCEPPHSKIILRNEYADMYNKIISLFETPGPEAPHHVIVTGQSGSGEINLSLSSARWKSYLT